ncbi:MAG: glycosyltransferase family 2 protein [Candidatus Micrarchaeota archaeon]|nr:glycosyltransferase family 2 protein [Candidatus Micrarchaeota archaeon]MDE1847986.1 glycosyltransferase family 2 protein [Candidatus Micrarchaeota archaeon]MDE1864671.1 glycosyltransferase family 2 protein [Candidatus Micrarchaeota archaeon]
MPKIPYVSVVLPTWNERENISMVIPGIKKVLAGYKYEIIIVDRHSDDGTAKMASRLGAKVIYDDIGKGSALMKGLAMAKGDILISMDADLSHEPKEFRLLIAGIETGYDICMGSRFITGGGSDDMPGLRRFGNKVFVFLVNAFFGANYSDLCYGYRSFRKGALKKLGLKERGFGIETEINIKAIKNRLKVLEVPSMEKKRGAGEGKLHTFRDGYVILSTIFRNLR